MKSVWFAIVLSFAAFQAYAQNIIYHNLEELILFKGDTVESPKQLSVEKRSRNQILLTGGADYKIAANRKGLDRGLRSRYYAVSVDNNLYVNCKKLRFNKFRFGGCYAPAMRIGNSVYFCAIPVGIAAVRISDDRDIGLGAIGEAISSSTMIGERVYYEIDGETGKVGFLSRERMLSLLGDYPDLQGSYAAEADNEKAVVTGKYLQELNKLK